MWKVSKVCGDHQVVALKKADFFSMFWSFALTVFEQTWEDGQTRSILIVASSQKPAFLHYSQTRFLIVSLCTVNVVIEIDQSFDVFNCKQAYEHNFNLQTENEKLHPSIEWCNFKVVVSNNVLFNIIMLSSALYQVSFHGH